MEELYTLTQRKREKLQELGMTYVCIWSHEWDKLKLKTEVASFISNLDLQPRLDPRESFFGGRYVMNSFIDMMR